MIEQAKRLAAHSAVDRHIVPLLSQSKSKRMLFGIGSGSTIVPAIKYIADKLSSFEDRNNVYFVPTSFQSKLLLQVFN